MALTPMAPRRRLGWWGRCRRSVLANYYYLKRPLLDFLPLLALLAVAVVIGGLLFHTRHPKHPSLAEGLFHTYCLIFAEHVLQDFPDDGWLRVFYVMMPMLGMAVFFDGILRFSYHVLRKDPTGKEWMMAMSKTMSNHLVLCGLGKVGVRVLQELLKTGEEVMVLEKKPDCPHLAVARKANVPVLIGSGREEGILDDLNIKQARAIILATDDDLANLEMAIDARLANPEVRVVIRLFDQELASKVRESFQIKYAFSTSALAAPVLAMCATERAVVNSFYVGDRLMVVLQLKIHPDSPLIGQQLKTLVVDAGTYVLSLHRLGEPMNFTPSLDTPLQAQDRVHVQTTSANIDRVHGLNRG